MNTKIKTLLEAYGLDRKEIDVYLQLAQNKELTAYVIAKMTKLPRSTTYHVLERLISKGFIHRIRKENKTLYGALDINNTIAKMKDKECILLSLIPEFELLKEKGVSSVRVFENKESQKQFNFNLYNQIANGKLSEVYIISGGPQSGEKTKHSHSEEDVSTRLLMESLLRELRKKKLKNIKIKSIWDEKFKKSKLLKLFSGLGEERYLKELPTLATTVIYGEFLSYLFTMGGVPQVIEIQNELIAEENKAYFNLIWKLAKP